MSLLGDIYDNEAITNDPKLASYPLDDGNDMSDYIGYVRSTFTDEEIGRLVAVWFPNAINGSHIMYPENARQLWYYEIASRKYVEVLLNFVTITQLVLPFFEQPYCEYQTLLGSNRYFSGGYPSRFLITIVVFIIINIQIVLDPVLLLLSADPTKFIRNFGKIQVSS